MNEWMYVSYNGTLSTIQFWINHRQGNRMVKLNNINHLPFLASNIYTPFQYNIHFYISLKLSVTLKGHEQYFIISGNKSYACLLICVQVYECMYVCVYYRTYIGLRYFTEYNNNGAFGCKTFSKLTLTYSVLSFLSVFFFFF